MPIQKQAQTYLRSALNNPQASFRYGQWETIKQLLNENRTLVVQSTGWGKNMVYFLATKLLREQGAGPTLLISPLLSLMRNQLETAERIGITTRTINSSNDKEWQQIREELTANQIDLLLISPELLANNDFLQEILPNITNNIGLLAIDEAHCISDWGHDFRPDYRRIMRVLQAMPSNTPVFAPTATANDRVVTDIKAQLGQDIILQRGSLARKNLKLQNISMPNPAARMAWLAQTIPNLPGSGIVYTLTKRDAERVVKWLQINGIDAKAYHADVSNREDKISVKEELEQSFLRNEIKVLVATVALGMGFDKPDIRFVIHFQRPPSVIHYYQQVGQVGRAVGEAYGILLCGEEDNHISDYFIQNSFPPQRHIPEILTALNKSDNGLSVSEMRRVLNLRKHQIYKTIKFLTVESPSPIIKIDKKWRITATATSYLLDQGYIKSICKIRRSEQQQMRDYMLSSDCLMSFLQSALDDPTAQICGKCKNCTPKLLLDEAYDDDLANKASLFLRGNYQPLLPKKRWPATNMFTQSELSGYRIPQKQRAREGRALSLWCDAGWGQLVAHGKYQADRFSDELVTACLEMLQAWSPDPAPKWVTCIPSLDHPNLAPDFAARLAGALGLPFIPCIENKHAKKQQKKMENSYYQAKNLDGVFMINDQCETAACLLIDDVTTSGWTFTIASALLRKKGCSAVYPMALALNSPRMG